MVSTACSKRRSKCRTVSCRIGGQRHPRQRWSAATEIERQLESFRHDAHDGSAMNVPQNLWQILGLIVLALVAVYLFQNIILPLLGQL